MSKQLADTFIKAVLKHTGYKTLYLAQMKLDILECQTESRLEPELHSLLMIILETLDSEPCREMRNHHGQA